MITVVSNSTAMIRHERGSRGRGGRGKQISPSPFVSQLTNT